MDFAGGYGLGRTDTDQASQERTVAGDVVIRDGNLTAGTDWTARVRDRNDYAFVQTTWKAIPRTFALSATYTFSRDQANYFLNNEVNTAVNLPPTYYRHQDAQIEGRFRLSDGTDIIGRYGYDTWAVNDFAAKDIALLGMAGTPPGATAIYLGPGFQDYTAHAVSLGFARKW